MIKTEWLYYYPPAQLPGSFIYTLQSWDTANKSGEINDYSVCTTWGVANGKYYLLDVFRRRLDYPEVLIEDKGSGTQLIQELKREGLLYVKAYEHLRALIRPCGCLRKVIISSQARCCSPATRRGSMTMSVNSLLPWIKA